MVARLTTEERTGTAGCVEVSVEVRVERTRTQGRVPLSRLVEREREKAHARVEVATRQRSPSGGTEKEILCRRGARVAQVVDRALRPCRSCHQELRN